MRVDRNMESGMMPILKNRLIKSTLQHFGMENSKSVSTPVNSCVQEEFDEDGEPLDGPYSELVVVLLQLDSMVLQDIKFIVRLLARFCSKPKMSHWEAANSVLWFLKRTVKKGIAYSSEIGVEILGFVDSDLAGDHVDRQSTTDYLFQLAFDAVYWRSKKHTIVFL